MSNAVQKNIIKRRWRMSRLPLIGLSISAIYLIFCCCDNANPVGSNDISNQKWIGTWIGTKKVSDTLGIFISNYVKVVLNADKTFKDSISVVTKVPGFVDTTYRTTHEGTWRDCGNNLLETTNIKCTDNGQIVNCESPKDTTDVSTIDGNSWVTIMCTLTKQ
jgi:hypothetical protein